MEGLVQERYEEEYKCRQLRKWDELSFLQDASHKRLPGDMIAINRLYNYCASVALLRFGRGQINGSFSPVFPGVSVRPPITVFSNGKLRLNFGNLCDEETSYICRDALAERLRATEGISARIPAALRSQSVEVPIEEWGEEVENVIAALEHMRSKAP